MAFLLAGIVLVLRGRVGKLDDHAVINLVNRYAASGIY